MKIKINKKGEGIGFFGIMFAIFFGLLLFYGCTQIGNSNFNDCNVQCKITECRFYNLTINDDITTCKYINNNNLNPIWNNITYNCLNICSGVKK